MSSREERQKQLLGDSINERENRRRSFLGADTQELRPSVSNFDTILEQRRQRILQSSSAPKPDRTSLPTFEAVRTQMSQRAATRQGITEPEVPRVRFGIPDRKVSELVLSFDNSKVEEARRDMVSTFFFGKQTPQPLGKTPEGFIDYTKEKGLVGTLYGTILKSSEQRTAERYEKLVNAGTDPEKAFRIARAWSDDAPLPTDVTEAERVSMRNFTIFENAFIALELADLLFVGKPINASLKVLTKGAQHQLFQDVAKAASAVEARAVITAKYPELAGTEGVEELIRLARTVSERDNWTKVLADTKTGREILNQVRATERVAPTTEAQRVLFENGIPVVRGGETAATTVTRRGAQVPNQTADAIALRTEIRNVLAGEAEAARLSNLDVFADEIKAGAFPFQASPDAPVQLFVSDTVADVTRLRPGERLATTKEVIEQVTEKGKAKMLEVMPDDVVRLADGSFVYAPKNALGKGISGTLRTLREGQRAKVQAIETSRELTKAQRAVDTERNVAQAAEQRRVNAAARAEATGRKLEQVSRARQVLATQDAQTKRLLDDTIASRNARVAEVRAAAKVSETAIREAQKTVRKLVTDIGKTPKAIAKARDKARKAIDATRALKRLTPKEKAKRIDRIRSLRDKEIKRLEANKVKLTKEADKARTKLADAKAKAINRDAELRRINEETKTVTAQLKADRKQALSEAAEVVKTADQVKAKARVVKAKEVNKEKSVDLATNLQEMYSNASAMFREADEAVPAKVEKATGTKTVEDFIKSQQVTLYRGGGTGSMPKGKTAKDVLDYEDEELGNILTPEPGVNAATIKSDNLIWLTEKKVDAKEYGSVKPVTGNFRIIARDGYGGVLVERLSEAQLVDAWKQANEVVSTSVTSPLNPVKGDGKTVANQIIKGLEEELEVIKQSFKERGLSLSDLPDTHKAIGNPTLLKQAFADMVEDPYKVYSDFVSGKFPDGTTRAAYGMALMKSDFVLNNPARMDLVARAFFKGNTRIAQELQSIKVFGRMDYLNIVGRFSAQADELLKARGVNVEAEAAKLMKLFGDEIDSVKTISKKDITDALTSITCKVE